MNRILLMVLRNIFMVPGAYIKLCHYAKNTEKYAEDIKYKHIKYIFDTGIKSGNIELKIYGKENLPKEDGFLMYSNHQGLFDIMAIVSGCDRPMAAVLKKELYNYPFLKQVVDCTKSYPIDRADVRKTMKVMQEVTEEVKKGRNYLIFPEGTRSKKGNRILEFHKGSFKCALKAKCPIVPIALIDCYKVLDEKGSKNVSVQMHYLEPIKYDEYKDMNTAELADLVRSKIEKVVSKA